MASGFLSYLRLPVIASSAFAALGSGLLYFKQNELIYPRNFPIGARADVPKPQDFRVDDAESLHIPTPDDESLHAYLLRPPNAALDRNITVLMFHGNAGNIGHRLPIAKVLAESLGCKVLMLEYRGYGLSTGTPDEHGLSIDAQTGLNYIRQRKDLGDSKIVIYGQSLGGAVAIKLVAANQQDGHIAGVVLENTFTSIRQMIPSAFPPAKYIAKLCHQLWQSDEIMPTITPKIPFLFLSGLKDEIVPAQMMVTLHELCLAERKVWKVFPNGHHNDTVAEAGYFDTIWDFLVVEVLGSSAASDVERESLDEPQEKLWG